MYLSSVVCGGLGGGHITTDIYNNSKSAPTKKLFCLCPVKISTHALMGGQLLNFHY